MKKIFALLVLSVMACGMSAQQTDTNPVVMTIAGKDIPLSDFLFIAHKDSGVDIMNKKSLENYVTLFKNFKLKVADAEAQGLDKTKDFQDELDSYEAQLRASYMSDKTGETMAITEIYNRGKNILSVTHIMFPLPIQTVSKDTMAVYQKALDAYNRIQKGEAFDVLGPKLAAESGPGLDTVTYETIEYVYPLQTMKSFENTVFNMNVGEVSKPVRSAAGYHIIRLDKKMPNPGKVRVSHILIAATKYEPEQTDTALLRKANEVYAKAKNGEDFAELAKVYSTDDKTKMNGGEMQFFGLGEMVKPFEDAAFSLKEIGDISQPVKTRYGYHIIKLDDRKPQAPYAEAEKSIYTVMRQGDRNFELYKTYDEREKKKFGYTMNQEAYDELQRLCDDYFPTDTNFYNRAKVMDKVLMHMNGTDFLQKEFAEYIHRYPFSLKTYSGDFMNEVYQLFVRDVFNEFERRNMDTDHPEFPELMKEYRDGILLFDISNRRVWSKPLEQQAKQDEEWIKELNKKYESEINWKVLKNLKKYVDPSALQK